MQKIYNIYIDTYRDNSVLKTNAEFVQGDADTNKFIIHLSQRREPFNLSGLTATITIKKADDEVIVGLCSIVDAEKGIIEYELGTNDISYPGYCRATVEVYEGESRLTSNIFSFDVREQLDDGESIESTTEYSVLQSLISDIQDIEAVEEARVLAEDGRVTAENERVIAENERDIAEDARSTAEGIRSSQEGIRVGNENERIENELARAVFEEWDSTHTYEEGNKVAFEGRGYYALDSSQDVEPGTDPTVWLLFADKGKNLEYDWDGTELGVRQEGEAEYTYVDLKGTTGDAGAKIVSAEFDGDDIKFTLEDSSAVTLNNAKIDLKGDTGDTGTSLEFNWTGTELGIRLEGEPEYTYVDLKGDTGDSLEFNWTGTQLGIRLEGEPEYTYVDLKGEKGDTGERGINWQGIYSSETTYEKLDGVEHNGSSYIYINETPSSGNTPPNGTYWDVLAIKGTDGEGSGDMLASVYDPDTKESDVFDSSNHDYDNTISGLTATNTKSAIDELQDSKVTKVEGKGLSTEDYTTLEKNKLAGIDNNANNYTHPATHPPSIIDEDENNRFVTDAEKDRWDNVAQTSATGNITVNLDSNRHYSRTGISGTISISEPSGTPQLGDKLLFTLKDNGTARTLSWDAVYKNGFGQELPATTVAGKQHIVGFMYVGNEWQCVAALEEE